MSMRVEYTLAHAARPPASPRLPLSLPCHLLPSAPGRSGCAIQCCYLLMPPVCEKLALPTGIHRVGALAHRASCDASMLSLMAPRVCTLVLSSSDMDLPRSFCIVHLSLMQVWRGCQVVVVRWLEEVCHTV